MKKIYIFAVACFATTIALGQDSNDTLTFESINLANESYYNGSDGAGQIVINEMTLSNSYNSEWGSWSGFSVSNVTDNTTAGYGNQYASFAGSGSASENYGVMYSGGTISFPQTRVVLSIDVTNTAYAGISMRDGDNYGKQFGSINGANGMPDGTNGEDFFILHIIPLDNNNEAMGDTVDIYLADFRFADNNQDYILSDWTRFDLSSYQIIANKIKFSFTSSDNSDGWMNTPGYFAMDNFVAQSTVGVNETNTIAWSTYPNPFNGNLIVKSEQSGTISITNGIGQKVFQTSVNGSTQLDLSELPNGIYYATIETTEGKNTQKIIKN